jgi:ubiquinone biosynthesis protein
VNNPTSTPLPAGLARRLVKGPAGFRQLLEKRGPTFIKIGQFLALRPDLLPQEYCAELMRLFDEVPPFPWHEARAIVRADLGGDPSDLFSHVDATPVAAGSLAQTYLWRLKNGTRVAVKVQRPGLKTQVLRDIRRARRLARLLEIGRVPLIVSPRDAVEEVADWLLQEIDFRRELANLRRLYRLTRKSGSQIVPRPYPRLSGERVVTAEYLEGTPVSRIVRDPRGTNEDSKRPQTIRVDRDRFAGNLLAACLTQIFRYKFFHADLHPGNLLVLEGDKVGFVDFGLCAELDDTFRSQQMKYLSAAYRGDAEQMYKAMTDILVATDRTDLEGFRKEFLAEARAWTTHREGDREHDSNASAVYGSPHARFLISAIRSARRNGLVIPSGILALYRVLLTAESVARQVSPKVDLRVVGRIFFSKLQSDEAWRGLNLENLEPVLLSYITLLRESPTQLNQMLSDLSDGRFTLKVAVSETQEAERVKNRRVRLVTYAVLMVGSAVLLTVPQMPELFGISLRRVTWASILALYSLFFLEWRKLR